MDKPLGPQATGFRSPQAGVRWLIAAIAIALVGGGGIALWLIWPQRAGEGIPVRIVTAETGTVEDTINEGGTLRLQSQQTLKAPAEGAVEQVLVNSGDLVQAGQVLVLLQNAERETALLNQQLLIEKQAAVLARSQAAIAEAETQLAAEQAQLAPLEQLVAQGAIPRQQVEDQADQVRSAQTRLGDAQSNRQQAQVELDRLQVERQKIQEELANTEVRSPISGKVLAVNVLDGDGVEISSDLLTVGNPAAELVWLNVSTLNASRVSLGDPARVTVIGPDPIPYTAQVVSIAPIAQTSETENSGARGEAGQVTVQMVVQLLEPTRTIIPGSQVNVEIILAQRDRVITVGTDVIQREGEDTFVWVLDDQGQAQRQPITLGLEGLTTVEVTTGLTAGDQLILPPVDQPLSVGTAVVPQSASEDNLE